MRASMFAIVSCVGLLGPAVALAQAPTVQPASVGGSEPLICHYYYHEGIIIRRQDCRTRHEWQRLRYEAQQQLTDIQMRSLIQH